MSVRLKTHFIPIWKEAPFLRFLIPFIGGILCQWYLQWPGILLVIMSCITMSAFLFFYISRYKTTYRLGSVINILLFIVGCWLVILKDARNWQDHIAKHYYDNETVVATLEEPLAAKTKTYKAIASVQLIDSAGNTKRVSGNIILYLLKDSAQPILDYGSRIIFKQALIPIKNAGNPGGFDYQRYAAFNNTYYQVFLKKQDYVITSQKTYNRFRQLLFTTRNFVINAFKKNIPGAKESGMAEALLVGYKEDLDKSLVEQYANTGVVHIIAISGMHLGLIYGLLYIFLRPLRNKKYGKIINAVLIISALWFFSLLTGAAPSITRSAIMFTILVAGSSFAKKSGIYNALALSAFLLLLVNPFNLWDVGFQLSYAALFSIAVLGKPITNAIHLNNAILKQVWQLIAITLAAQVFTLPLVLFHFHQFPISFLLANIVAVPLSSIILYCLLALLALSWMPVVPTILGWCTFYLIKGMNGYIAFVDSLPFSKIEAVSFTIPQSLILVLSISVFTLWLFQRTPTALISALVLTLSLLILRKIQFYETSNQHKLIVYNVSKQSAIDIINGRHYRFIGDTALQQKGFAQNFNLLPSRILYQASFYENVVVNDMTFARLNIGKYSVLIMDKPVDLRRSKTIMTDYLLVNKNCKAKPYDLLAHVQCKNVILDASNSRRSIMQWKNAADSLHLRLHSVQEQGAFIIDF
jgi:competence protein ComEC